MLHISGNTQEPVVASLCVPLALHRYLCSSSPHVVHCKLSDVQKANRTYLCDENTVPLCSSLPRVRNTTGCCPPTCNDSLGKCPHSSTDPFSFLTCKLVSNLSARTEPNHPITFHSRKSGYYAHTSLHKGGHTTNAANVYDIHLQYLTL